MCDASGVSTASDLFLYLTVGREQQRSAFLCMPHNKHYVHQVFPFCCRSKQSSFDLRLLMLTLADHL